MASCLKQGMTFLPVLLVILEALHGVIAVDLKVHNTSLVEGAGIDGTAVAFEKFKAVLGGVSNVNEPGPINGGFRWEREFS